MSSSLSRDAVRAYDREAIAQGIPGSVLMENAGRGVVDILLRLGVDGPITVVCGKGNNAGDGFVIARWLRVLGKHVEVVLVVDPAELAGDASIAFKPLAALSIPLRRADKGLAERLRHCQWVIDAVLGTGAVGTVRPEFATIIEAINNSNRRILAVDLPSGLDCDTGLTLGTAVRAEHTVTFVARKLGFDNPASEQYTGQVHVVPIGWR